MVTTYSDSDSDEDTESDSDESDDEEKKRKTPLWAHKENLGYFLHKQSVSDPYTIFTNFKNEIINLEG
jgi:hypothetical protein